MDAMALQESGIKQGLYLAMPHGELIWQGRKKTVIRPAQDNISGQYILVSGKNAYGLITVGDSTPIPASRFDEEDEFIIHRVTPKERERWWPGVETLYSHEITAFEKCDEPIPVVIPNGVRMLMNEVEFKATENGGDTMPYSTLSEANPAIRGIKPPVTLAQANLIASWADSITDVESPWAVAIAKFKRDYRVEGGRWVKKQTKVLEEVLEAAKEGDVVIVKGPEDEAPEPVAEVAPEPESTEPEPVVEAEPEQQEEEVAPEEVQQEEQEEQEAQVEVETESEEADTEEADEEEEEEEDEPDEKAVWTTAYINNLPDSSFLYVEPGGKKNGDGKTVPRSKRHFPVKDTDGKVDLPHLRNALSRLGQSGTGAGWLTPALRKRLAGKARRMLATARGKEIATDIAASITDGFKSLLTDLLPQSQTDAPGAAVTLVKSIAGEPILITRTTNAFKDREDEIFATDAIKEYVGRHSNEKVKGTVRYRHFRGTDFADIVYQGVAGRFLIEASKFKDTPLGQAFQEMFEKHPKGHPVVSPEGWGTSHGFSFSEHDRTEDGVYKRFEKIETSVLPAHVAANPYTTVEVVAMSQKDRAELATLIGDVAADEQFDSAEDDSKRLEEAGVEHKEITPTEPVQSEEAKSEEPALTEEQGALVKALVPALAQAFQLDELAKGWETLTGEVREVKERLAEVEKADDERLVDSEKDLPRYPWSAFHPSQADETKIEEGKQKAKTVPVQIDSLVGGMIGQ